SFSPLSPHPPQLHSFPTRRSSDLIERHNLVAANNNGPGQIVAAGTLSDLERFAADPPPKTRLVPLKVAGAFHTHYVAHAVERLGDRKSTRLNSSHVKISYAVFCLK